LLILDEPTIGLDPNQVRQVRQLIKDLAAEQTIILSTHILAEVEMICNRVVIIDRGLAIASSEISSLIEKHDEHAVLIEVEASAASQSSAIEEALAKSDKVARVERLDAQRLRVCPSSSELDLRPWIFAQARDSQWSIVELRRESVRLEDVFVKLTHEAASREEVSS
jgi:ABC-2 type transport system ATP-binding protein